MRSIVIAALLAVALQAAPVSPVDARKLYDRMDFAGAIVALSSAPPTADNLALIGQSHYMLSDFRKASDVLEKAAALAPADSLIQTWLGRAFGRRAETAMPFAAIGLAGKTREAFERAVHLDSHNCEAVNDLFDYYLQAPGLVGGGTDKARTLLPLIQACDPSERQFAEARLHEHHKQFSEAEALLRQAVETAPKQIGRHLDLARFLYRRGRFEEGEKVFEAARKVDPASPRILYVRAEVYIETKRNRDQARILLKQYISSDNLTPDDPSRSDALRLLKKAEGA